MKYGVLIIVCLLLASCATMKNAETRPTEGSCVEKYDSAKTGEKEALAGTILMPIGVVFTFIGVPIAALFSAESPAYSGEEVIPGAVFTTIGGMAIIASIVTLADGHHRVNEWNNTCTGATAAERYCLFEPLSEQKQ